MGKREDYTTGTGQKLKVHSASECEGQPCPIHNPSDHPMRDFPTHWRDDRGFMERICPHGVGHPDPDDYMVRNDINGAGVHGCDGCCTKEYPISRPVSDHFHPGPALSKEIVEQQRFVAWLKKKGMYNPMESADNMVRMMAIWSACQEDKNE